MLHDGRYGGIRGELRRARLFFQFLRHHPQLPGDAQVEGVVGKKPAAPGQFHEIHLRRHPATIWFARSDVSAEQVKSTEMVKSRLVDK
jgi:hypothetical protein